MRTFATRAEARAAVAAWIEDYNYRRRHSACQTMSPVEYEQALAAGKAPDMACFSAAQYRPVLGPVQVVPRHGAPPGAAAGAPPGRYAQASIRDTAGLGRQAEALAPAIGAGDPKHRRKQTMCHGPG